MRIAVAGLLFLTVGVVAFALGVVSFADVASMWARVWPILLFVVAITVVTELSAASGLFTVAAERVAVWGMGRAWLLWGFIVVVALVCTVFLSLDTTAVLLTPVVVLLAKKVGLDPFPFALTTVWLANTTSMLLPVSNLTNLLAQHSMNGLSPAEFAILASLPAVAGLVVPVVVVFVLYRRVFLKRYVVGDREPLPDLVLLWSSAIVVVILLPLLVSGVPVWCSATVAALVLVGVFAVRRPAALRFDMLPWQLVLFASGLFLLFTFLHSIGLGSVIAVVAGSGQSLVDLLRLAAAGLVGANLMNNLPAYLALEPVAGSQARLFAILIGVNIGSLVTPWASLATLLWHQQLEMLGVRVLWRRFIALGAVVAPATVLVATCMLWLAMR